MNTKKRKIVKAVLCAVLSVSFFWGQAGPFVYAGKENEEIRLLNRAQRHVLDNGMVVLIEEMPASTSVGLYALVKTGSATEGKYLGTGISHFLEHMLFKGTEKRPVGTIAREIKSAGGFINASTSFDYTVYLIEMPKEDFPKALDVLSDMLMNSKIDPEEVEKEREVVFGEMRLYKDRPERKLSEIVLSNAYIRHPYRHTIIGYEELLRNVSRDEMWDYYKTHYTPNNIIFAVAGGISADDVLPQIRDAFESVPRGPIIERHLPQEPPQLTERYVEEEYETELTRVDMTYKSVPLLHPDLFALDVLAVILGQARSSRLIREVYEKKKLVNSVGTSNFTPMDRGLFEIEMTLEDKNLSEAIAAVKDEIEKLKRGGVTSAELEKAKRKSVINYVSGRQTVGQVAWNLVSDEAYAGDFMFSKNYVDALKQVTAEDVRRVANEYLKDSQLTTAVLRPKGTLAETEDAGTKLEEVEVRRHVLENGLTVLLRENHAFPLVTIQLLLKGGVWQEPPELNGVAELTGNMMARETRSRSPQKLEELLDSRGISGGSSSGRYTMGYGYNVLSEDLELGLSLIEDALKNIKFSEKEFTKFKDNMKPAIINRQEDISFKTSITLRELLFPTNSLRRDAFGTLESLENVQLEDVIEYYEKLHRPSNMVLAVFGDIQPDETLEIVRKKFSALKQKGGVEIVERTDTPPEAQVEQTIRMPKEQAVVMVGFQSPGYNDQDEFAVHLLRSVLGSSLSGRIFKKIRDELGKAYTLGGHYSPGINAGYTFFYVNTTDENVEKVKEILLEQIGSLKTEPVTDQEMSDSKAYLKGKFKMSLDSNSSMAHQCAFDELFGLGFDHYKSYEASVDAVTKEDVLRAADEIFSLEKAVIVITRPESAKAAGNPK